MIRTMISTLVLGAALVSTAPALAQDAVSVHVPYGDLNLTSDKGQRAFHARLEDAAVKICGATDRRDPAYESLQKPCLTEVWSDANKQEREVIAAAKFRANLAATSAPRPGE